jgi:hypothetical protein
MSRGMPNGTHLEVSLRLNGDLLRARLPRE